MVRRSSGPRVVRKRDLKRDLERSSGGAALSDQRPRTRAFTMFVQGIYQSKELSRDALAVPDEGGTMRVTLDEDA